MMQREYNKLVRDRIPEIIRDSGRQCGTRVLGEVEYVAALRAKLVEEAQEAAQADAEDLGRELADVQEVIDALMAAAGIDADGVARERERKRIERGGFRERILLLWTK